MRARKHDWRSFLTDDEAEIVRAEERKRASARQILAEVMVVLDPIRNRAIQRSRFSGRTLAQHKSPGQTSGGA